jgi:drug/metabolite transporter (DMT)-like permease
MSLRDRVELLVLAAIWGASFLFMRVAAPEFGPLALIEIRVLIAALFLGGILAWRGGLAKLRGRGLHLTVLGTINSAVPFSLFAFAALALPAGYNSVLNATVPLFGTLVAYLWLRESTAPQKLLGLLVGFSGVVLLVWPKLALASEGSAVVAGLAAALLYGIAAHYTKRTLAGVEPLVIAAGSQIGAAVLLLPAVLAFWPAENPSLGAWGCALALGTVCTGVAYILYFRLITHVGPARAVLVTYLIPVFGLLWGTLLLGERLTWTTVLGCAVILLGTATVGGILSPLRSRAGVAPSTPAK